MKTLPPLAFCVVLILNLMMGCETIKPAAGQPDPALVQAARVANLSDQVRELQEKIRIIQQENQALGRQIEALQAAAGRDKTAEVRTQIEALQKQIQAVEKAREQDKAAIVEEISKKIAAMLAGGQPTVRGDSGKDKPAEFGYEHVVRPNETLSQIAQQYKVGVGAILKANNLKDANSIRSGQKLFIPEGK